MLTSLIRHNLKFERNLTVVCAVSISFILASAAHAGQVSAALTDKNGQAMQEAVLFATPVNFVAPPSKATDPIVVAQENSVFSPYLSVIRVGTSVRFPNRDAHDHHLKSFSPAKVFELRVKG